MDIILCRNKTLIFAINAIKHQFPKSCRSLLNDSYDLIDPPTSSVCFREKSVQLELSLQRFPLEAPKEAPKAVAKGPKEAAPEICRSFCCLVRSLLRGAKKRQRDMSQFLDLFLLKKTLLPICITQNFTAALMSVCFIVRKKTSRLVHLL